ncbi:unnamed protein product [Vicia faba]|uniref:Uncharacterized protein n=1 Tax=Vicia faba TaxID=3906 RepID=A0AAV0Z9A0_VICFA|nr:unnamed protein product [Vicia faba]
MSIGFQISRSKFFSAVSSIRNPGGAIRSYGLPAAMVVIIVLMLMKRKESRRNLTPNQSRLLQIILEKDGKIAQLLHQIAQMNEILIDSHKALAGKVRPENKLGDDETWDRAESALKEALDEFGKPWQVSSAWLLYKSSTAGNGFLSATLQGFSVFDDREGVEQGFRLAIGKPESIGASPPSTLSYYENQESIDSSSSKGNNFEPVQTMLIVDMKFGPDSTFVSVCIQRPQLLVALDFLLAVVEFFVPTVSSMLSFEEHNSSMLDAIIIDQSIYKQPCAEFSLSPQKPLIVDDENFDHFIYDGDGGILYLKDGRGLNLTSASSEAIIYIGNGKKLQFRNVVIKGGQHLDSCVFLGANSSYSALNDDHVYLEQSVESPQAISPRGSVHEVPSQNNAANSSAEVIVELQAVGPELTFYNTSKDVGESSNLSNKLLLAQLDAFCR